MASNTVRTKQLAFILTASNNLPPELHEPPSKTVGPTYAQARVC